MVNWPSYNKSLVRRGGVILDFDVIDSWYSELDGMNNGKIGCTVPLFRFVYPVSRIREGIFHLPYRQAEGVVMAHAGNKVPSIPNYSTINRRVNTQDITISERHEVDNDNGDDDDIIIALDSTGIKVANRGEWMRHKWQVRKGYLKIHVAADIKRKRILSLEVTSEEVHDGKILVKLD
jgi:hypothetical protein